MTGSRIQIGGDSTVDIRKGDKFAHPLERNNRTYSLRPAKIKLNSTNLRFSEVAKISAITSQSGEYANSSSVPKIETRKIDAIRSHEAARTSNVHHFKGRRRTQLLFDDFVGDGVFGNFVRIKSSPKHRH